MRDRALVAIVLLVAFAVGCRASTDCSCPSVSAGVVLQAPTGLVEAIETAGGACADAQIRCVPMDFGSQFTAHCAEYQILPRRPGDCQIVVNTSDGRTLQKDLTTISVPGCWGGVVAADPADAQWVVGSGADAATDS